MRLELVTVTDERGEAIWFIDFRGPFGGLIDSRFFATQGEAEAFMVAREWEV